MTSTAPPLELVLRPTLALPAPRLGERLGCAVTLIVETLQHTGSFKFRAAYSVAHSVPNPRLVTASSGNFGQALAYACKKLGKGCTVVMPDSSARVKIDAVRSHGAHVELIDVRVKSRGQRVAELAAQDPEAYVASAYDDPLVIAGNATLGREIAGAGDFDDVVVPVGGGGLSAGVAVGLADRRARARLWGAEPALANDAARSLAAGELIANAEEPRTIADGARTLSLGRHNWSILRDALAGIVEVSEERIAEGLRRLFLDDNVKSEPTGALAVGALLTDPKRFRGRWVACVVSGGNVDPASYAGLLTAG